MKCLLCTLSVTGPIRCIHHSKPIELFLVNKLNPGEDFPDDTIPDVCGNIPVV